MLWYIYFALICINIVMALTRIKFLGKAMKINFALILWTCFIELLRKTTDRQTTTLLTHVNFSVELLFQFAYFNILLHKNKRYFLYGGLTFFVTALFVTLNVRPSFFLERYYIDAVFAGVCIAVWSSMFFYELIHKPLQYSLKSDGNFWVNCGNILFYPGTLLLFGLGSYVRHINPELEESLLPLNYGLNLTLYVFFITAFFMEGRKK